MENLHKYRDIIMEITLNGSVTHASENVTINELLLSSDYKDKMVAVAINGEFIPKSDHKTHIINDKDEIEIVAPMQGG